MKEKRVALCGRDRILASLLAKQRLADFQSGDVLDHSLVVHGPCDGGLDGAGGEIAFARLVYLFPENGPVFKLADGSTCEVQTSRKGDALWIRSDAELADYFVLMTGAFPTYQFFGFLKSEGFDFSPFASRVDGRDRYVVPASELNANVTELTEQEAFSISSPFLPSRFTIVASREHE